MTIKIVMAGLVAMACIFGYVSLIYFEKDGGDDTLNPGWLLLLAVVALIVLGATGAQS